MKSLWLSGLNILGRGAQFGLFWAIATVFGAFSITDEVYRIYTPLLTVCAVLSGVIEVLALNYLSHARSQSKFEPSARLLYLRVVQVSGVGALLTMLLLWNYCSDVSVLSFALLPLLLLPSAMLGQLLNVQGKTHASAMAPLAGMVVAAVVLLVASQGGYWLALVLVAYELGRYVWLVLAAKELSMARGCRISVKASGHELELGNYRELIVWQLLAGLLMGLVPLINLYFANHIGHGAITMVEYVSRLWNLAPLLLSGPLTYLSLALSRMAAENDIKPAFLHRNALSLFGLGALIVMPLVVFRMPFIDFLYGVSGLSHSQRQDMADLLALFLLGAPLYVAGLAYVRALSACGCSNLAALVCLVNVSVAFGVNHIYASWGLKGIGLGHVAMYLAALLVLIVVTRYARPEKFAD